MARPTKLNPTSKARIIAAILACNTKKAAAAAGGIGYETFNEWMKRGALAPSGQYREFYEDVTRALQEAEALLIGEIRKAGQKQWQALAWIAERRYPERWARINRTEVTGRDGGPVEVESAKAHLKSATARIAAALEEGGADR